MFSCVYSERRERVLGTSHCIVMWLEEVYPIEALKLWTVFVLHDCSLIVPLGAHLNLDCFIVRLGQEINITVPFANLGWPGQSHCSSCVVPPNLCFCVSQFIWEWESYYCVTHQTGIPSSLHVWSGRPLLPACHCTRQRSMQVLS